LLASHLAVWAADCGSTRSLWHRRHQ